jgi:hypothetical protein
MPRPYLAVLRREAFKRIKCFAALAERAVILAEGRANVERLSGIEVERHDPVAEDTLQRWQRQRPQPEPPRRQREPTAAEVEAMRGKQWDRWLRGISTPSGV